jgi:MoxR-like ATPase
MKPILDSSQSAGVPPLPRSHQAADEHLRVVNDAVRESNSWVADLRAALGTAVVGQQALLERMLVGLLANGNLLLEGAPGLAKTLALKALAKALDAKFARVQFTPDMLPADIVGTEIYNAATGRFDTKRGPIFANLVLADEINRAPAKVQSALLEAMQEGQVTIGDESHVLPDPFLVMATQNPIEQEGTYPLPEAQMDRFMLKVVVDFPTAVEERRILDVAAHGDTTRQIRPVVTLEQLARGREVCDGIHVDERLKDYIVSLVLATRRPKDYGLDLGRLIRNPVSPRGSLALLRAAKAMAYLNGRGFVTPNDIKAIALEALRHRVGLTYEAEADGVTPDEVVGRILDGVRIP